MVAGMEKKGPSGAPRGAAWRAGARLGLRNNSQRPPPSPVSPAGGLARARAGFLFFIIPTRYCVCRQAGNDRVPGTKDESGKVRKDIFVAGRPAQALGRCRGMRAGASGCLWLALARPRRGAWKKLLMDVCRPMPAPKLVASRGSTVRSVPWRAVADGGRVALRFMESTSPPPRPPGRRRTLTVRSSLSPLFSGVALSPARTWGRGGWHGVQEPRHALLSWHIRGITA